MIAFILKVASLMLRFGGWVAVIAGFYAGGFAGAVTVFVGVLLWMLGQTLFYALRGYWKSRALEWLMESGANRHLLS